MYCTQASAGSVSVKGVQVLQKLENTLKGIYKYYHGSPKRRREIKAIAEILDSDLAHIPDVKDVSLSVLKNTHLVKFMLLQNCVLVNHIFLNYNI